MAEDCACLTCDVIAAVDKHHPDGIDGDAAAELLGCFANLAAQVLATCTDKTAELYLRHVRELRTHHQAVNAAEADNPASGISLTASGAMH